MNTTKFYCFLVFGLSSIAIAEFGVVQPAMAAPAYNIVTLGLDDLEHTRNDGYRDSGAGAPDELGHVGGSSKRYNGGNTELGSSVWLYNGATTTVIGLTGAEHTSSNGVKSSFNAERFLAVNFLSMAFGQAEEFLWPKRRMF